MLDVVVAREDRRRGEDADRIPSSVRAIAASRNARRRLAKSSLWHVHMAPFLCHGLARATTHGRRIATIYQRMWASEEP